jgi:hypothetical protein
MLRKLLDICIVIVLLFGAFFLYVRYGDTTDMIGKWTFTRQEKPRPSYEMMKSEKEAESKENTAFYNLAIE